MLELGCIINIMTDEQLTSRPKYNKLAMLIDDFDGKTLILALSLSAVSPLSR